MSDFNPIVGSATWGAQPVESGLLKLPALDQRGQLVLGEGEPCLRRLSCPVEQGERGYDGKWQSVTPAGRKVHIQITDRRMVMIWDEAHRDPTMGSTLERRILAPIYMAFTKEKFLPAAQIWYPEIRSVSVGPAEGSKRNRNMILFLVDRTQRKFRLQFRGLDRETALAVAIRVAAVAAEARDSHALGVMGEKERATLEEHRLSQMPTPGKDGWLSWILPGAVDMDPTG